MADWEMLTLLHVLIGYQADVLGLVRYGGGNEDTQALLIVAFILYTVAAILMALTKAGVISLDLPISISAIILLFIAGLFLIIGVGLYKSNNNPYAGVEEISAALLAWLGVIFLIIKLVGGAGGGRTTPS